MWDKFVWKVQCLVGWVGTIGGMMLIVINMTSTLSPEIPLSFMEIAVIPVDLVLLTAMVSILCAILMGKTMAVDDAHIEASRLRREMKADISVMVTTLRRIKHIQNVDDPVDAMETFSKAYLGDT